MGKAKRTRRLGRKARVVSVCRWLCAVRGVQNKTCCSDSFTGRRCVAVSVCQSSHDRRHQGKSPTGRRIIKTVRVERLTMKLKHISFMRVESCYGSGGLDRLADMLRYDVAF